MAYTLNTSHALYGNLVELIGVQGGALVSHKTVRTFAPHATSSFVSGSLGAGFKTGVKGWNVNGASLSPTVTIDTNANPNLTVFIAVNNIGTAADICGALTTSTVSFGVNGNTGMGLFDEYNPRGTFKTPTIVNNGAHSLCAKRLGETTAASYVDGVLGSTDSVRLGFTTGAQNILSYIGGYDGQGSCGGIEFVWIAIFNKALSDAEVADLHSSLGGSNAFGLVVGSANAAPTFLGPNIGNQTGTVGAPIAFSIASKFSDTDALTFSLVGSLPAGLTLSTTGLISGTPTTAQTKSGIQVIATDTAAQAVNSDTFSYTISAAGGDVTNPTMSGVITISAKAATSYTASWSAGSDNVAVTGYQYRLNSGVWNGVGNVLTTKVTGRAPGATDVLEVRAQDAAGNFSTALSVNVTLNAAAGSFTSDIMENNTGAGVLSSTPVNWTWYNGVIGSAPTDMIHGSGATSAGGTITATGLPVGVGFLLVKSSSGPEVSYHPGTVT